MPKIQDRFFKDTLEFWSEKGLLRERDRIMLMIKHAARTHLGP